MPSGSSTAVTSWGRPGQYDSALVVPGNTASSITPVASTLRSARVRRLCIVVSPCRDGDLDRIPIGVTTSFRSYTGHAPHTTPTRRPRRPATHMHPQRPAALVADTEHLHIAQSHQQLTHARRVALHRDPPVIRRSSQCRFWGIPRVQPRTLTLLTPTSNAKSRISGTRNWTTSATCGNTPALHT